MSSPRLVWRGLPFAAKALILATAGWAFLLTAVQLPWAQTAQHFQQRQAERAELAPLLDEAERLNLTFPQVVVSHPAYLGKPVYWAVQVISTSSTRIDEHPAWQVLWTNPERLRNERIYGDKVLARVAAVRDDVVYLDFIGRP